VGVTSPVITPWRRTNTPLDAPRTRERGFSFVRCGAGHTVARSIVCYVTGIAAGVEVGGYGFLYAASNSRTRWRTHTPARNCSLRRAERGFLLAERAEPLL
jgi:hypothetical protein